MWVQGAQDGWDEGGEEVAKKREYEDLTWDRGSPGFDSSSGTLQRGQATPRTA